jgi:hypothetical protein
MVFIGSVGQCNDPGSDLFTYIHSASITCAYLMILAQPHSMRGAYWLSRNLGLLPLLTGSIRPRLGPLHVCMSLQVLRMLC